MNAERDRLHQLVFIEGGGKQDDPDRQPFLLDGAEDLQAAFPRHLEVKDGDIGIELPECQQGRIAVCAALRNQQVLFKAEEVFQGVEDEGMIVGDDQADGHESSLQG
jgi:hypothetical protein